jgi:hypothetical protein
MAGASPFDFVKSASSSIENEILNEKLDPKGFSSFVFLRSFANFEDTVMLADEINAHSGMPPSYVYHSMHALIDPKRNRFSKWIRPVDEFEKEVVARTIDIFEVSRKDAVNILRRLQEEGRLEHFVERYVEAKKGKK